MLEVRLECPVQHLHEAAFVKPAHLLFMRQQGVEQRLDHRVVRVQVRHGVGHGGHLVSTVVGRSPAAVVFVTDIPLTDPGAGVIGRRAETG